MRKSPVKQVSGNSERLGNHSHGYNHPYADGSRIVLTVPGLLVVRPISN
jgi:hypothetical protein